MKQLSRVCMISDHYSKHVKYVCVFPECALSRFLCNRCLKVGNHRHQKYDQNHILDHKELYDLLNEKINQRISGEGKKIISDFFNPLKQIIQEIHCQLKNIINIIEQKQQELLSDDSYKQLNQKLLLLKNNGYDQFDEKLLNMLVVNDQEVGEIYSKISDQSNNLIQNIIRIQQWCYSQQMDNNQIQIKKLNDVKHTLITQDQAEGEYNISSSAISNDFKYVVSGGTDQLLKIWNYQNNTLIKQIQLDDWIHYLKFTDDSSLLYVGTSQRLLQFDANNNFIDTYNQSIHSNAINTIFLITNTILLTSSFDKTILKTDYKFKQQLLAIQTNDDCIFHIDYNRNLNMIASASSDNSIKLWNGNNGELIIEKKNEYNNNCIYINQVLFTLNKNQLISLDNMCIVIIWNINYETKTLEKFQQIEDSNLIFNISLVLDQQFIVLLCQEYIKIYTLRGDYVRSFEHNVQEFFIYNSSQPHSMKAFLIQGKQSIQICKLDFD